MKTLAALVLPLILAVPAFATINTYDWTGRVVSPNKSVSAGTTVHGTIAIDDAAPRTTGDGQPDSTRTYQAVSFSFTAANQTWSSNGWREYTVTDSHQGIVDCSLDENRPIYYSFDWNVNVRDNRLDLFSAANLDRTWRGGSWGMEVSDPADGYFTDGFSGLIQSLTRRETFASAGDAAPTPEPSSAALLGTTLLAWLGIRVKGRRRAGGPSYI